MAAKLAHDLLLPYEPTSTPACGHSTLYRIELAAGPFCGLCFLREGWDSELPTRIHLFKTLAENGNPETSPKFFAHLYLVEGLVPPALDAEGNPEPLHQYRKRRGMLKCNKNCHANCTVHRPLAREQYTEVAWRLFPVGSALWKLMGYQPPLGVVLVKAVSAGRTEQQIATELGSSLHNIVIRMSKAVRTTTGYLNHGQATREPDRAYGGDSILSGAQEDRLYKQGASPA